MDLVDHSLNSRNRIIVTNQQLADTSILDKVTSIVDIANRTPSIARQLQGWDRVFVITVDGQHVSIATSGGSARVQASASRQGQVWFGLSERTLDLLIAGRLSPLTAKLSGRLNSDGSITDILRFANIFSACLRHLRGGYVPGSVRRRAALLA